MITLDDNIKVLSTIDLSTNVLAYRDGNFTQIPYIHGQGTLVGGVVVGELINDLYRGIKNWFNPIPINDCKFIHVAKAIESFIKENKEKINSENKQAIIKTVKSFKCCIIALEKEVYKILYKDVGELFQFCEKDTFEFPDVLVTLEQIIDDLRRSLKEKKESLSTVKNLSKDHQPFLEEILSIVVSFLPPRERNLMRMTNKLFDKAIQPLKSTDRLAFENIKKVRNHMFSGPSIQMALNKQGHVIQLVKYLETQFLFEPEVLAWKAKYENQGIDQLNGELKLVNKKLWDTIIPSLSSNEEDRKRKKLVKEMEMLERIIKEKKAVGILAKIERNCWIEMEKDLCFFEFQIHMPKETTETFFKATNIPTKAPENLKKIFQAMVDTLDEQARENACLAQELGYKTYLDLNGRSFGNPREIPNWLVMLRLRNGARHQDGDPSYYPYLYALDLYEK